MIIERFLHIYYAFVRFYWLYVHKIPYVYKLVINLFDVYVSVELLVSNTMGQQTSWSNARPNLEKAISKRYFHFFETSVALYYPRIPRAYELVINPSGVYVSVGVLFRYTWL